MNPEAQRIAIAEVLQQINDALSLAEKATPGPFVRCNNADVFTNTDDAKRGVAGNHIADCDPSDDKTSEQARNDATFLVASRTLLPKSLRSLKTAIEGLLVGIDARNGRDFATAACENALTTLCDQWEVGQ